jgi:isoquinoline 1-oxidoreductase subunit beta
MNSIENFSRRDFLRGSISAGALVLGIRILAGAAVGVERDTAEAGGTQLHPNVYLAIDTDGSVFIVAHRSEMGQGVRTALPRIVAEELDADWERVTVLQADGDVKYGNQDTDGSASIRTFFEVMRQTGGTARLMLLQAAAQKWGVPVKECSTEAHKAIHVGSSRSVAYGELVTAAAGLPVPKTEELQLKDRNHWRYIGKAAKAYDTKAICMGAVKYGQDARIEGMLFASIQRSPVFGGQIKSLDDSAALQVTGVRQTATIDRFKPPHGFQPLGGVAVLADNSWAAAKARKKLKIKWESGANTSYNSVSYREELQRTARKACQLVRNNGDVDSAFREAGKIVEAEYYTPLLSHSPMEPPAALADFRNGKVELWTCTQNPQGVQEAVAEAVGVKKEDVTCHVTLLGGGFGRKSFADYAAEAAVLSKKAGAPVKVVWTREDDIQFDYYHPAAAMYFKAALDLSGKPTSWLHRSVFPPIKSTFTVDAVYPEAWELACGSTDVPFAIPNLRVENGAAQPHLRFGWFRSVCNAFHAYGINSFADELAHAAGSDPVQYLLGLLGPDRVIDRKSFPVDYPLNDAAYTRFPVDTGRFRRVLELAAEKSGWGNRKPSSGEGWGVVVHRTSMTYVASVLRVEVDKDRRVKILRVDTAADAGTIVNPEGMRKQYEGAAVFGTSLARYGEITAMNGVIDQSNFHNYQVARMNDAPRETFVHLVSSESPPTGIGESGVPPIAPALCNAIFAATGERIRELPLSRANFS